VDQSWTGPLQRTSASVPSWLLVQDPRRDRRGRIWLAREVSTRPAASARGLESSASTLKPDIRHNAVRIRVADHGKPRVAPCLRPVEKRRANPLMTRLSVRKRFRVWEDLLQRGRIDNDRCGARDLAGQLDHVLCPAGPVAGLPIPEAEHPQAVETVRHGCVCQPSVIAVVDVAV
jgi:hypothetical protein